MFTGLRLRALLSSLQKSEGGRYYPYCMEKRTEAESLGCLLKVKQLVIELGLRWLSHSKPVVSTAAFNCGIQENCDTIKRNRKMKN